SPCGLGPAPDVRDRDAASSAGAAATAALAAAVAAAATPAASAIATAAVPAAAIVAAAGVSGAVAFGVAVRLADPARGGIGVGRGLHRVVEAGAGADRDAVASRRHDEGLAGVAVARLAAARNDPAGALEEGEFRLPIGGDKDDDLGAAHHHGGGRRL